jgi:4-amino-4-deoxy-L-arabinose transferase-like glycosyltransferase
MKPKLFSRQCLFSNTAILVYLVLIKFMAHILVSRSYGYFIDELYTIAESKHLDFGFIDMPPLVPAILAVNGWMFGYSLQAIRFLPAVCGAFMVVFAILMVRKMGGGMFARFLAGVAVIVVPIWLAMNSMFTYDCFDQLITVIFCYVLLRILAEQKSKLWLLFGVVAGIGLMTKLSMAFFGLGLLIALLLTKNRKYFAGKWLWLAGLIIVAITSPFIIWEIRHGWPIVGYWKYYSQYATYHASPLEFLLMQIIAMHPLTLPLWLLGLYYLLFSKEGKQYALLGVLYIAMFFIFMILKAKVYMLTAAYVMLFAAGAVYLEKIVKERNWSWLKPTYLLILIISGIFVAPNALPVLAPDTLVKYLQATSKFTGVASVKTENFGDIELPQYFADRFGWDNQVDKIAGVYRRLSPAERKKCAILAGNYGEAGAVDLLGEKHGLPKTICNSLSYYLWGTHGFTGEIAISVGIHESRLYEMFDEVTQVDLIQSRYAMPRENNLPVYVCRRTKYPVKKIWMKARSF